MEMRHRNLIAAIVFIALGIGYAILTSQLPTRTLQNSTQPSFFPWIIVVCLFVLSGALLIQSLLARPPADEPPQQQASPVRLAWILAFVCYLVVLPGIGFVVANVLFFGALMYLYGDRNPIKIVLSSIVVPLVLFFLFRNLFQIRLPAGVVEGWI